MIKMPTSPIGNTPRESGSDLVQGLKSNLANGIAGGQRGIGIKATAAETPRVTDVASVLLSQVATSDVAKLASILDPAPDASSDKVLDSLLRMAVQAVGNGNAERAVGYLADYATRDPRRAEALPFQPELEPVRDQIDSMVNRMASVAKMSAENGLSLAEQTAADLDGKLSNWDTHADVLVKVAQRLYDAGGYANYSRSAEISKVVSEAGMPVKAHDQALAAAASTAVSATVANQGVTEMLPGINVPYWVSDDFSAKRTGSGKVVYAPRRTSRSTLGDIGENFKVLKEISSAAVHQLWMRAPLLVMMLAWLTFGLMGGVAFAVGSRIWPESLFVAIGNLGFTLWALGFLAMVGFGFYARVRFRRLR